MRRHSLVLAWEAGKDAPSDEVANGIYDSEGHHRGGALAMRRDLWEWVTVSDGVLRFAPALIVAVFSLIGIGVKLIVHEGFVAVLEDGEVLELLKEPGDVLGGDEETGEEHERNNEDRRQCHCKLLVRERGRDNERITWAGIVDEDENEKEHEEVSSVRVVANEIVDDTAEDHWGHDREGKLRDDLGPEIWSSLVHIVIDFSQEYRSFVGEDKDNILDGVERDVHGDKEEGTLNILDTSFVGLDVEEEENSEEGS